MSTIQRDRDGRAIKIDFMALNRLIPVGRMRPNAELSCQPAVTDEQNKKKSSSMTISYSGNGNGRRNAGG